MNMISYFEQMAASNKLAVENNFKFCRITSVAGLEEVVRNMTTCTNFFCIDTVTDAQIFEKGGAYYERQVYMVGLFSRFNLRDMADNMQKLDLCRELRKQICSKMLRDKYEIPQLTYFNTESIMYRELEQAFLMGLTGTYFTFNVDVPTDLCYKNDQWL